MTGFAVFTGLNVLLMGENLVTVCSDENMAAKMRKRQLSQAESLWDWEQRMDVEILELQKLLEKTPTLAHSARSC